MRRSLLLLAGAAAIASLGYLAVFPDHSPIDAYAKPAQSTQAPAGDARTLELLKAVIERIRAEYIDNPDEAKLVEAAINGMLASLDPHSDYLDAKKYRDLQTETRGEFGGVGIRVTMEDGLIKVVAAIDDTPAAKAGVLAGDVVSHLDGQALRGINLADVVDRMRGPVNSKVRITVLRKGENQELTLTRAAIKLRPVEFRKQADVGYIRLMHFNYQSDEAVKTAIRELSKQKVAGYVLDLRNNPGGLINQAVAVARNFLDQGEVVSLRGRFRNEDESFDANSGSGDMIRGKPMVVLINGGSASSAEIVAGALQDHKRATVVGTPSYGKGSVQTIIPLGAGNGAIRLTTARYYTPSGRSIQALGIKPDIEVVQDVPKAMLVSAEMRGEASLPGHLKADGEERSGSQSYVPADPKDDKALAVALEILRGSHVDAFAPTAKAVATPGK